MASQKKVALVTGTNSGIGLDIAIKFASEGYQVYATVRSTTKQADLIKAAEEKKCKANIHVTELDVTNAAQVNSVVDHIQKTEGHIDVLVNNAGFGIMGPAEAATDEDLKTQYETNIFGAWRLIRAVLPSMRERKSGTIINISSVVGVFAFAYTSVYSSSKFALEGLTQALYQEVGPLGLRIVLVEPGYTKSNFNAAQQMVKGNSSAYSEQLKKALEGVAEGIKKAPPSTVVSDACWKAVTDAKPQFRYQCTEYDEKIVAAMLKDSHGLNAPQLPK